MAKHNRIKGLCKIKEDNMMSLLLQKKKISEFRIMELFSQTFRFTRGIRKKSSALTFLVLGLSAYVGGVSNSYSYDGENSTTRQSDQENPENESSAEGDTGGDQTVVKVIVKDQNSSGQGEGEESSSQGDQQSSSSESGVPVPQEPISVDQGANRTGSQPETKLTSAEETAKHIKTFSTPEAETAEPANQTEEFQSSPVPDSAQPVVSQIPPVVGDETKAVSAPNETNGVAQKGKENPEDEIELPERHEMLEIEQNMAEFLEFGEQVDQIFVANPEIADVQVDGNFGAYIFARKPGSTSIIVNNKKGKVLLRLSLRVTHNLEQLRQAIKAAFPNEGIKCESTQNGIVLSGPVSNATMIKDAENLASGYIAKREMLINRLSVSTPTQIMLKVKIAEVNRTVLDQFGINWTALTNPEHFLFGIVTGREPLQAAAFPDRNRGRPEFSRAEQAAAGGKTPWSYGARYKTGKTDLSMVLDALNSEGLATVLAEPNLVAMSGETASFLVGGEFPIPVPQAGSATGAVTIEFKEYGVWLSFRPTVLGPNRISLLVRPEVSDLDFSTKISIQGTDVPGLITRRAETTVELGNGQAFAIAGLLGSITSNQIDSLPGLDRIPILSALFRSTKFQKKQTELVIIVEPHLVDPTSDPSSLKLPTDDLRRASNLEMLFYGRLNRGTEIPGDLRNMSDVHLSGHCGFNVE